MKNRQKGISRVRQSYENGILIFCHHGLTNKMIKHIHNSINEFIINKIN